MPVTPNKGPSFLEGGKTLVIPGKKLPEETKESQTVVRPDLTGESAARDALIEKMNPDGKLPADDRAD